MWCLLARQSRYASSVSDPKEQVDALRKLLEAELDRRLQPQWGCWPLLIGVLGVLLGIVLLAENF